jgi:leucyl aminopeptidase
MKTKLITNQSYLLNLHNIDEYEYIVFLISNEDWNDSNHILFSKSIIDKSKVIDFDGSYNTFEYNKCLLNNPNQKVLLFGLGNLSVIKNQKLNYFRKSFFELYKTLNNKNKIIFNKNSKDIKNVNILLNLFLPNIFMDKINQYQLQQLIDNLFMIISLSNYQYTKHLSEKPVSIKLCHIYLYLESNKFNVNQLEIALYHSYIMSKFTNFARNLINERGDICNPQYIEDISYQVYNKYRSNNNLNMKVIKGEQLKKENMNLFYAVGQGSIYPSRLIVLEYNGNKQSDKYTALVGKGISFDSGGLNIKTGNGMENMYMDMSGSAVVLSVLQGIMEFKLPINIVIGLCVAENMIDNKSYRPYDILKSRKGLSVEISNTDAEGRLVMADTMTYLQDNYNINTMIDIATLTGAVITALGDSIAGIFGNNQRLIKKLIKSGNYKYERCWQLPILEEHIESLKGEESDIISKSNFNGGGASIASAFLSKFVNEGVNWAHLDIAGTSKYTLKNGMSYKSGTGFGVGLLLKYFLNNNI